MNTSEHINELAAALAKAQGKLHGASKDSINPHFRSRYADLESVWQACRGPLSEHGLSVVQTFHKDEQRYLRTMLLHSSGQWVSSDCYLKVDKDTMQGLGSAITYARRYGLMSIVGIAPSEDDDGNLASGRPERRELIKEAPARIPAPLETYEQLKSLIALIPDDAVEVHEEIREEWGSLAEMAALKEPQHMAAYNGIKEKYFN